MKSDTWIDSEYHTRLAPEEPDAVGWLWKNEHCLDWIQVFSPIRFTYMIRMRCWTELWSNSWSWNRRPDPDGEACSWSWSWWNVYLPKTEKDWRSSCFARIKILVNFLETTKLPMKRPIQNDDQPEIDAKVIVTGWVFSKIMICLITTLTMLTNDAFGCTKAAARFLVTWLRVETFTWITSVAWFKKNPLARG